MAEIWGAALLAGAVVVGGVEASSSAGKAADAQKTAAADANATQLQMYNQTRDDQAPWRAAGTTAIGQLSAGTQPGGEFDNTKYDPSTILQDDPGYQFRMDQGNQALERSAAARGGLLNGGTLKALDRYNSDYASGEYASAYSRYNDNITTRFNRLSSIAGTGQTATQATDTAGQNAGNNISANQIGVGNANAANYIAQGNAVNNGISSLGSFYLQQQYLNKPSSVPTSTTASPGYYSAPANYSSYV